VAVAYFRALASRCRTSARDCSDLYAKEDFRRLAQEFDAKADEFEFPKPEWLIGNWKGSTAVDEGFPS
jgi:hypothetical protein